MYTLCKITVCVCMFFVIAGCASNREFHVENDVLALDSLLDVNDDRNLTMTVGVSWYKNNDNTLLHRSLSSIDNKIFRYEKRGCSSANPQRTTLGITAFTPDDLEDPEPILNDRPYASLLYYSANHITQCVEDLYVDDFGNQKYSSARSTNFNIALIGTGIARVGQRFIHNELGVSDQDPLGWSNQISNGGELSFLYAYEKSSLLRNDKKNLYDISYSRGLNIGYYTNAFVGITLRRTIVDKLNSPFYYTGGSRIDGGTESGLNVARSFYKGITDTEGVPGADRFLFLQLTSRAVLYNALLQGQFRNSEVTFSSSQIENFVHQLTIGLSSDLNGWCRGFVRALGLGINCKQSGKSTRMTFALHARSPEFEIDRMSRSHVWGGLYFTGLSF